jgi:hypothetical protein
MASRGMSLAPADVRLWMHDKLGMEDKSSCEALWAQLSQKLGATVLCDLRFVNEADLRELGMLPLPCRRFVEAASTLAEGNGGTKVPVEPAGATHYGSTTDAHRELEALIAHAAMHAVSGFQARA